MTKKIFFIPTRYVGLITTVNFAFFIFLLSAVPDLKSNFDPAIDIVARKIAHATEFAILTYFIFKFFENYKLDLKISIFYAFATAVLYALSDEIHQKFVPGREMSVVDILIDSVGIFFSSFYIKKKK